MSVRFKFLTGDMNWQTYGGKFVSRKLNNGEFDYWLVMEVMNWGEATGEACNGDRYYVNLSSVSPSEAGEERLEDAFECCGLDQPEHEGIRKNLLVQVECLDSYGVKATIWQKSGNNLRALMKEARVQAQMVEGLYGFYMDRVLNRVGDTGWDFQRGEIGVHLRTQINK